MTMLRQTPGGVNCCLAASGFGQILPRGKQLTVGSNIEE
jgi:hypothetical protein